MEIKNSKLESTLAWLIYSSLMVLALGLVTSTSLLALFHILMAIPAFYFLFTTNYRTLPKSAWALLLLSVIIVCSVVFNQDLAVQGYKTAFKVKYFLFGFLSIAPIRWYFEKHYDERKIKWLIYAFCIATTVATVSGLIGLYTGFNPILMKAVHPSRNSGLFGMLMNYAHNLSYFLILLFGLIFYQKKFQVQLNRIFMIFIFLVNLIGFYFTYTRGVWIALAFGIPLYYFWENKKKFIVAACIQATLMGAAYIVAGSNVIRPASNDERVGQWKAALYAAKERPVLGYGYLIFESHTGEIKKRYNLGSENFVSHAHNNFFEMIGSTGLLGLIAFLSWITFWVIEQIKNQSFQSNIVLAFILVFIIGGLTQSTISLGINLFFIMAVYAISSSMQIVGRKQTK